MHSAQLLCTYVNVNVDHVQANMRMAIEDCGRRTKRSWPNREACGDSTAASPPPSFAPSLVPTLSHHHHQHQLPEHLCALSSRNCLCVCRVRTANAACFLGYEMSMRLLHFLSPS
jgi:hypothetical protein